MLSKSNVPVRTHSWGFTACSAAVYVKNKQTHGDLVESYWACSVLYWALWLLGEAANFLRLLKHFHLWMHWCFFQKVTFFFFFQHYWEFSFQLSLQLLRNSTGLNCYGSVISSRYNFVNHVNTKKKHHRLFFVILQSSWFFLLLLLLLVFLLSCFFLLS